MYWLIGIKARSQDLYVHTIMALQTNVLNTEEHKKWVLGLFIHLTGEFAWLYASGTYKK